MEDNLTVYQSVITDIRGIISSGQENAYHAASKAMVLTYWHIGKRIAEQEQKRNLQYFRKFYLAFPDEQIVNACVHKLN